MKYQKTTNIITKQKSKSDLKKQNISWGVIFYGIGKDVNRYLIPFS